MPGKHSRDVDKLSLSDCTTVCAFSGISSFSSLVSFHNLPVSFSMLREDVFVLLFFMPGSACLELLSCKFCFGFVVGGYIITYRAEFHLLSESAGSTVEFLHLCIPTWDVVSPPSCGNCLFGSAEDGSVNSFTFSFR